MKLSIMKQNVSLFTIAGFLVILMFSGCEKEAVIPYEQESVNQEIVIKNTTSTITSDNYFYYTPVGSKLGYQATPNCHSYAWQNSRMPSSVPNYGIYDPTPFWKDGSYVEVTGQTIKEGDRANYGGSYHSAVVCGVQNGTVLVNSYWAGKMEYSVPATKYGTPRYYRIADTKYWNTPNLPRRKVAFKACYNDINKYVCADFFNNTFGGTRDSDAPLWSNRTEPGPWETFYLINAGNGYVWIWSYATFSYVKAFADKRAIANGGYPGNASTFKIVNYYNDRYCIQWKVNNHYLHYGSFIAGCQYPGKGSSFYIEDL